MNPTALFDVHCRVGGYIPGTASSCITINSSDVILDQSCLWRSDDGAGVGWGQNDGASGLIVNGDRVTAYALFVEHFEQYQRMWNGNDGSLFFYQPEEPYDVVTAQLRQRGRQRHPAHHQRHRRLPGRQPRHVGAHALTG
jgi:hypothetical protein